MKRFFLFSILLSLLSIMPSQAQTESNGWYGGVSVGVPSGYSSFRPSKVGYSGGLFAGYRFNRILSLEGSARLGRTILGTYDCIANQYVGADGQHYYPAPSNMTSWQYSDIKSYVDLQQYALQLNINILGFFNRTKDSRWRVEIAPLISALGSKADLRGTSLEKETKWHMGLGGNVQAGYWFTNHFGLLVYVDGTHLTGARLDGIPKFRFINNYLGEAGVKFAFGFGKSKKVEPVQEVVEPAPVVEPVKVVEPAPVKVETKPVVAEPEEVIEDFEFSRILFDVNKANIKDSEAVKIKEAAGYLKENPEKKVTVAGWTDPTGNDSLNAALSLRRANAVQKALIAEGVAADRISVSGNGVLTEEGGSYQQSRAVIIKEVK
jgi:outer membrane protein OmpA-like peptidoglycan-associated protein